MRIILNGQQAFGQTVLESLLDRNEDVVAVFCAPDREGRKADPLKELALSRNLPVYQPASYKKPDVWEQMKSLEPDLGVMAFVTSFIPEEALNIPTHGTIQYHPSLLPLHRGPSSINWPIIFGEKKTGLSIFWPDNGLDEGPILLQKEVEISDHDTLGSIYFDKLFPLGVEAMMKAVDLVRDGNAPKLDQDHSKATYESWCRKEDVEIDWSKPVEQVYNLIRGANPQPSAWTTYQGESLQIFDCSKLSEPGGSPGEIVEISEAGIAVAARGGRILVTRVRPAEGKKQAVVEFVAAAGLVEHARFG